MNLTSLGISFKWNFTMFVFLRLAVSPSQLSSRFIHIVPCQNFLPFQGWVIFHCLCRPRFVYPSVSGHLGCFHLLAVVSKAAVNTAIQVSVLSRCFHFFWVQIQKCNCWIIWSFYAQIFEALLYCFPQQLHHVDPISMHQNSNFSVSFLILVIFCFVVLIIAILVGMKCPIVVLRPSAAWET